jgi:hypothetical protein
MAMCLETTVNFTLKSISSNHSYWVVAHRCAHAHGKADLRSKEEAAEEWRRHTMAHTPATRARLLAAQQAHSQSPRVVPDTLAARQSPSATTTRLVGINPPSGTSLSFSLVPKSNCDTIYK